MFHPLSRELSSLVRIFITFPLLSDTLQLMAIERLTEALLLGPQPSQQRNLNLRVSMWSRGPDVIGGAGREERRDGIEVVEVGFEVNLLSSRGI